MAEDKKDNPWVVINTLIPTYSVCVITCKMKSQECDQAIPITTLRGERLQNTGGSGQPCQERSSGGGGDI